MPITSEPDASHTNGETSRQSAANLFVDGDPDPRPDATHHHLPRPNLRRGRRANTGAGRPGGRVVAVAPSAKLTTAAGRFELPGGRPGTPRGLLARVDGNARTLCAGMAGRPYVALVAFVCAGALLVAVSWTGLSLHDDAHARRSAVSGQRAAQAAALAEHHNVTLTRQLDTLRRRADRKRVAATNLVARFKARAAHAERELAAIRRVELAVSTHRARSRKR